MRWILRFIKYKINKMRLLLFQGAEFDVYKKFADDILKPNGRERLNTLLQRSDCIVSCQVSYSPLSRRLDRCDRMIQNESRDPNGGYVYYVTMQIMFSTCNFRIVERNLHCDVVHITTIWVSSLTLDCNGVFAIKAYCSLSLQPISRPVSRVQLIIVLEQH